MALNFPWEMFLRAQEDKNKNRQQEYQDIAGLGKSVGQTAGSIGNMINEKKKAAIVQHMVQLMQQQGQPMPGPQQAPIQGPAGYVPPGSGPSAVPAGQQPPRPPVDNTQLMKSLAMQYDPKSGMKSFMDNLPQPATPMNPLQKSEIAKNNAETKVSLDKPDEIKAAMEEKQREAENNRQLRTLQMQTNQLLAQGRLDEARAKIEETRAAIAQRAADAKAARTLKRDTENSKHWFPWTKLPPEGESNDVPNVTNFTVK